MSVQEAATTSKQPKQQLQLQPQHQHPPAKTMQLHPASGLMALAAAAATGEPCGFTLSPHVPLPVPQAVTQTGAIPHHLMAMHQQQYLFTDRFSILQGDDSGKLSIPYLLNQGSSQLANGLHESRAHQHQFATAAATAGAIPMVPFVARGWLPSSTMNDGNDTGRSAGQFPFAIPILQPRHSSSPSSGPLRVVGPQVPQQQQQPNADTASNKVPRPQQHSSATSIASSAASSSPQLRRLSDSWSGASSPNPSKLTRGQSPGLSSGAPSDDDDADYVDDGEYEETKANLRQKGGLSPIGPIKKKRASQQQVSVLEQFFATDPLPTSGSQRALAEALGMTQRSVQLWFQNKRAKLRRLGKTITPKQKGITFHHFSVANNGKLRMVNEEGSADLHGIL